MAAPFAPEFEHMQKHLLIHNNDIKAQIKLHTASVAEFLKSVDQPVVFAIVTEGARVTAQYLKDELDQLFPLSENRPYRFGTINASSYDQDGQRGELVISEDELGDIQDHIVIIVDDIFDTGHTVEGLKQYLLSGRSFEGLTNQAVQVEIFVLLEKPERRETSTCLMWSCFKIGNYFVVGFGMDGGPEGEAARGWVHIYFYAVSEPQSPAKIRT